MDGPERHRGEAYRHGIAYHLAGIAIGGIGERQTVQQQGARHEADLRRQRVGDHRVDPRGGAAVGKIDLKCHLLARRGVDARLAIHELGRRLSGIVRVGEQGLGSHTIHARAGILRQAIDGSWLEGLDVQGGRDHRALRRSHRGVTQQDVQGCAGGENRRGRHANYDGWVPRPHGSIAVHIEMEIQQRCRRRDVGGEEAEPIVTVDNPEIGATTTKMRLEMVSAPPAPLDWYVALVREMMLCPAGAGVCANADIPPANTRKAMRAAWAARSRTPALLSTVMRVRGRQRIHRSTCRPPTAFPCSVRNSRQSAGCPYGRFTTG